MNFEVEYDKLKRIVESRLRTLVASEIDTSLRESMLYSLLGEGKRLRPVLFLAVMTACGAEFDEASVDVACAIECVHTYSLIHDDLPIMDNDDMRRGKPTNHKVYGEAIALLAGDGLLNLAYEVLFGALIKEPRLLEVCTLVAKCAGARGMVGGQSKEFSHSDFDLSLLEEINVLKTGALFSASIFGGAICADANDLSLWEQFAVKFGKLFQLVDDLCDVGDEVSLVAVLGRDEATIKAKMLFDELMSILDKLNGNVEFIKKLCIKFLNVGE